MNKLNNKALLLLLLLVVFFAFASCTDVVLVETVEASEDIAGWPPPDIMEYYGLEDMVEPQGATSVFYTEEDDALIIKINGTIDIEFDLISYFIYNSWVTESSSGEISEYSRGTAYVIFNAGGSPSYYEIEVYRDDSTEDPD